MVAADKRATDIYAYSDTGNLDLDGAIENTGLGVFMEGAVALYEDEVNTNVLGLKDSMPFKPLPGIDEYDKPPYLPTEVVSCVTYYVKYGSYETASSKEPMVSVKWDQCHPYNYYCPSCSWSSDEYIYKGKCVAGCVPVAMAQIMSYHKYPASYVGYEFAWNAMTESTKFSFNNEPNDNALMVAHLIREIGRVAKADYGKETSATLANIKTMFPKFGYNITGADYDVDKVKISLINNRPVFAYGSKKNGGGHFWVIDGYDHLATRKTYYYNYAPYNVHDVRDFDNRIYVHCNWGWSGEGRNEDSTYPDKGYFLNDAFVVTIGEDSNEEERDYTKNNKIIYNIHPKQ